MSKIRYSRRSIITDVLRARDRDDDFSIDVEGRLAGRLYRSVQSYIPYRDGYIRKTQKKSIIHIFKFFFQAMKAPTFWSACVLADVEAKQSTFEFSDGRLSVFFTK